MKIQSLLHNKTIVNGSLFSLFSFFGNGLSFLLLIILANYIFPADYGKLSLFNSIILVLGFCGSMGADGYVAISFFRDPKNVFAQRVSALIFITFAVSIVSLFFLLFFGRGISNRFEIPYLYVYYAVAIMLTSKLFGIQQEIYRVKEKVINYGIYNCSNALTNFVLSIVFVVFLGMGWTGRVYSHLIYSVVFSLFATSFLIRNGYWKRFFTKDDIKTLLVFGIPMIPHKATLWIRQGCDQYIINDAYSTYEVGLFSFALNLVSVIIIIGTSFNNTNAVDLYKVLADGTMQNKKAILKKRTKLIALLYSTCAVAVVIIFSFFVPFFLPKYTEALPYFWILSFYGLLCCLYFLVCNYLFYYKKTKNLMYITFSSSILHLLLSLIFTRVSLYYTACIYVLTQLVVLIIVFFQSKKIIKKNIK